MSRKPNASLIFIFITVLIDVIGIGIIIPVFPSLIAELNGSGMSDAARVGGWLIIAYAAMQFFFAPVLGQLSDKFGRRPIILIALLGLGLDYIFHAWAPTLMWLFVGRILAGITGASFTVASAYIADISTPEKKAQNFGMLGAAFGLGFIIGPVIGGVASEWGIRAPFLVAAALSLLNFLYGLFILPESHPKENRVPFNWKKANPFSSFMFLRKYPGLMGFVLSFFIIYVAGHAVQSTWGFFTMYEFDWDETTVGYSLALVGAVVAIVQGGLVQKAVAWFGQQKTVIIGMSLWALGMFLFAFASNSWMMFAFIIPYCLGGIAGPTLQGIVSNKVPVKEQGKLQGALTSLISLSSIIGPAAMTYIFYTFTQDDAPIAFSGAAFFAGGILMLLSLFLVLGPLRRSKLEAKAVPQQEVETSTQLPAPETSTTV
jgi:DHA1 family tetracycline resistance protein-like MFS transporter